MCQPGWFADELGQAQCTECDGVTEWQSSSGSHRCHAVTMQRHILRDARANLNIRSSMREPQRMQQYRVRASSSTDDQRPCL
jgi:hypothetical protein